MVSMKPIPSQEETDWNVPEEHFLWAMRSMPSFAGAGCITHSGFLRTWSKHLWDAGFCHRDYLEGLADEDGNIHISRIPHQTIKFQEAFRGPHHTYNNAARWVSEDTPDPAPVIIPNLREHTIQEKYALAYQLKEEGIVIHDAPGPSVAEATND